MSSSHPLIFVVGPTATGKSHLALELAKKYQGSIFNCDSLQVYQRLDIGTAKPSLIEREVCPHDFFDFVQPGQLLTAGDYRLKGWPVLAHRRQTNCVFAVGGSGFYIQALEKGLYPTAKAKAEIEASVRHDLERLGLPEIFNRLKTLDPESAEELNPNDSYRIVRALIACLDSGRKWSDIKREFKPEQLQQPVLKFAIQYAPDDLRQRIRPRTEKMLQAGWIDEVEALVKEGFANWSPLQSVGYKEILGFLRGDLSRSELPDAISQATQGLAKKQRTWFRRDKEIQWLEPSLALNQVEEALLRVLDRKY